MSSYLQGGFAAYASTQTSKLLQERGGRLLATIVSSRHFSGMCLERLACCGCVKSSPAVEQSGAERSGVVEPNASEGGHDATETSGVESSAVQWRGGVEGRGGEGSGVDWTGLDWSESSESSESSRVQNGFRAKHGQKADQNILAAT